MLNEKTDISASNLKGGNPILAYLLVAVVVPTLVYLAKTCCENSRDDNKTKNHNSRLKEQNQYEAAQHERAKERKSWN